MSSIWRTTAAERNAPLGTNLNAVHRHCQQAPHVVGHRYVSGASWTSAIFRELGDATAVASSSSGGPPLADVIAVLAIDIAAFWLVIKGEPHPRLSPSRRSHPASTDFLTGRHPSRTDTRRHRGVSSIGLQVTDRQPGCRIVETRSGSCMARTWHITTVNSGPRRGVTGRTVRVASPVFTRESPQSRLIPGHSEN